MSVTTDVTTTSNGETATVTATGRFSLPTFDKQLAVKPLFAAVGVADLAIEQAKDVPADVTAAVKALPTQLKASVSTATEKAGDVYSALTIRGQRLVTQIRRQPATEAAIAEGKEAVRKAEAAATAARKSARAGEKALEDAAAKIG
ncbi:MAG: hypothetical protein KY438_11955 [Actinobacteria bacterium]|nr:hypothetical protein [Actinomycetota bacterium]